VAATDTKREVRAEAKWVRISPRKARLVAEHIRGRSVPEARTVLAFTQRAAAREIEKVLRSAVANAEANHGLIGDDLVVSAAYIDEGPTVKRWRARARGRVNSIKKRTCHITIKVVQGEARIVAAPPAGAAGKPKRSRRKAAEAPVVETPSVQTPAVEATVEEVATTETPEAAAVAETAEAGEPEAATAELEAEPEAGTDETPSDETPSDETPSDETPSDETPSDQAETEEKES
jgi:large subunit ribosomal protein L22